MYVKRQALDPAVSDAKPDVALVKVVPRVRKVLTEALFLELYSVIAHGVHEEDVHAPAENDSVVVVALIEYLVDVYCKEDHVKEVNGDSIVVEVLGVLIP